jgi:hypothetical protein
MFKVIVEASRKVSVIHAPLRAQAPRPLLLSYHILVFIQASKCYQITMTDLMGHITALTHRRPGIGGFGPENQRISSQCREPQGRIQNHH